MNFESREESEKATNERRRAHGARSAGEKKGRVKKVSKDVILGRGNQVDTNISSIFI